MSAIRNFWHLVRAQWHSLNDAATNATAQQQQPVKPGDVFYPEPSVPDFDPNSLDRRYWAALAEARSEPLKAAAVKEMNAAHKALTLAVRTAASGDTQTWNAAVERWNAADDELRAWLVVDEQSDESATVAEPELNSAPGTEQSAVPIKLLTSWREILIALGMKNNQEDKGRVSRLNKTYDGPIRIPGQGKQPLVDKTALIDWWNRLAIDTEGMMNQTRGARSDAESGYDYGRSGKAVPGIGGGIKQRRRDRKP